MVVVVTLTCCLTSRDNDVGRPCPPAILSREAQLKKKVRACAWGEASCKDAFAWIWDHAGAYLGNSERKFEGLD